MFNNIKNLILLSLIVYIFFLNISWGYNCESYEPAIISELINQKDPSWSDLGEGILKSRGSSGFSNLSIIVEEPCDIIFEWKIDAGYNSIELFDNNKSRGFALPPDYRQRPLDRHTNLGYFNRYYPIRDYEKHEIKWIHFAPTPRLETAYIRGIRMEPLVCFINPKLETPEPPILSNADFNFSINVNSNYSSFPISLFIKPPNINNSTIEEHKNYFNGEKTLEFKKIVLKCNDYGKSEYWYEAYVPGISIPIKSKIFNGPIIDFLIKKEYHIDGNKNYIYTLNLKGDKNAVVNLLRKDNETDDWKQCGSSQFYTANTTKTLSWSEKEFKRYYSFDINFGG
jgi:hypothetical protein